MTGTTAIPPRRRMTALARIAALVPGLLASLAAVARAQAPNAGFTIIGHIEAFTLTPPAETFSAATIRVRGVDILLPRNLVITMPGGYATPRALFNGQANSGLALADPPPRPRIPFEAEVIGNITATGYVAGVVRISQGALHVGSGFIQDIVPASGELRIGNPGGMTGARVRLNDPQGIYSRRNADRDPAVPLDARFALDPDNAPVHARTGFPVCIPRPDAEADKCPAASRPGDQRRFTCAVRGPGGILGAPAEAGMEAVECDPTRPVPLHRGDFVSYVGMLQEDPAGGFIIAAHGLEAELGIYTSPGIEPAYLFVEEAIQGTKGERFTDIPQEETTRLRIVGFTTDPSRNVVVELVDGDPPLPAANVTPFTGETGLTPSNGPQLGRFRRTWPSKDDARAVRREVRVRIAGATPAKLATTGLTSGQYVAPVSEYIYPEPTTFGVRGFPLPVPFESFCFLSRGGMGVAGLTPGRLNPFPDSGHPLPQQIGNGIRRVCDP